MCMHHDFVELTLKSTGNALSCVSLDQWSQRCFCQHHMQSEDSPSEGQLAPERKPHSRWPGEPENRAEQQFRLINVQVTHCEYLPSCDIIF